MSRAERIQSILQNALSPEFLEVIDESSHHAGHAGAKPEGETHYRLRIRGGKLAGLNRVEQHRQINTLLAGEFQQGLHALAIEVLISPPLEGGD